ncbi:MAG: AsmA family protein [Alphaproteobacteria bacterium]|nr:AsmA family protein [Alphaproteobacteria bacterium]
MTCGDCWISLAQESAGANARPAALPTTASETRCALRKLLILFLAGVGTLAVALLLAPFVVDLDDYRGEIAARAKAATGREVAIAGGIDLFLLPAPGVRVGRVSVASPAGFVAPDVLSLEAAEAEVALWPLLRGEIQVARVRLVAPVLSLERRADGAVNWAFGTQPSGASPAAAPASTGATAGARVSVGALAIEGGRVSYRDAASGGAWEAERIDARLALDSLAGPFRGRIEARVAGQLLTLEASTGRINGAAPAPVSFQVASPTGGITAKFDGSLAGGLERPQLSGRIQAEARDGAAALAAGGFAGALPPGLTRGVTLRGELAVGREAATLDDLKLVLGDVQMSGAVSARFGADPRVDVALAAARIDLDALLPAAGAAAPAAAPAGAAAPAAPAAPARGGAAPTVGLDLGIDALVWRGGVMRGVKLAAQWQGDEVIIEQVRAQLPGATDAALFGTVRLPASGARFEGQMEATSDNLRALLEWQKVAIGAVPADRLRSLSLATDVTAEAGGVTLAGLDLRLDSSRLTGSASVRWSDQRYAADLALDRINLDAYLAPIAPAVAPAPALAQGKATPAPPAAPWTALAAWDGRVAARIAALTYQGVLVEGIELDAATAQGMLTVRRAQVRNVAGARAQVSGQSTLAADPEFRLTLDLVAPETAALARLAGLPPQSPLARMRPSKVAGTVAGRLTALTLDLDASLGGLTVEAAGQVSDLATAPALDLTLDAKERDVAALLKAFDIAGTPFTGPAGVRGRIKGPLAAAEVWATLTVIGAAAQASGRFGLPATGPVYDLKIEADHPHFARLLATLRQDPRFARSELGPFHAAGVVAGDAEAAKFTGVDLRLGPTQIKGDGTLALAGPRPRLTASLAAGDVIVDLFIPPDDPGAGTPPSQAARPAAGAAAAGDAGRWSREPLDLSGRRALDAQVEVTARSVAYDNYRVDGAALALDLADGVLTVERLAGVIFKGRGQLGLRLADARPATLDLTLTVAGADLGTALKAAAGSDDVTGTVDLDGKFQAVGGSAHDLVASLAGAPRINGGKGMIQGIDLRGVSDRLQRLNNIGDFAGLLQAGMAKGQTRLDSLAGTFEVRNGVATTRGFTTLVDAGQGVTRAASTCRAGGWT